jgi:acetylornithine/succinyldiaminopimelate/putrescine aminotransferase
MAKPLANGYPIGAVLIRPSIAETMTAGKCFAFYEDDGMVN